MTPHDIGRYAKIKIKVAHEESVSLAWLTARLTTVGFHSPKEFPKSVQSLIGSGASAKPFTKEQWEAAFRLLAGKNAEPTKRPPLAHRLNPRKK